MPAAKRTHAPPRIRIRPLSPVIDAGRYAPKRCVGDRVTVAADVFSDGHEKLRAVVRFRSPGGRNWLEAGMLPIDAHHNGVRWEGAFAVEVPGRWEYGVEAWIDLFATWRDELARKVAAAQDDLSGELSEGVVLLEQALARTKSAPDRRAIEHALSAIRDEAAPSQARYDAALSPELDVAMERAQERHGVSRLEKSLPLAVDRVRARFGSWYELFPRSWGGIAGVEAQLPALAELGFDVVYMTPIHPIGVTNRKGRNNTLAAGRDDPGSPYAVGGEEGGHDAVHPELGTVEDVRSLCAAAREHGMDVAMDFAINASADHPWLTEHPEWFHRRPDGTLKYAENPPKKYQDIYNVNWECEDWRGLWDEWLRVFLFWVDCGVKVYRVDNPHTKPFAFWEWLIAKVHEVDRDVIFLAEAFTRRAVMRELAKLGFTQSYTYFTWKTSRHELTEYVDELAHTEEAEYFRPNFFPVTPDILEAYLVHGGPGAFYARLMLAGTLSPSYGVYSGYEHFENVPVRPGSEEYADSEKYELKARSLDGPLLPVIGRLNAIRRENPALQVSDNVHFLETHNDALVAYAKSVPGNTVLCVVSLDPHGVQEGSAVIPAGLGLAPVFPVEDLFTGEHFDWRIGGNYVRMEAGQRQAHVLRVVS